MSAKLTHYQVLGISESATPDEIKGAWRRLAKKYHPDWNKGKAAATRIRDINLAYHDLCDSVRRADYDLKLRHQRTAAAAPNPPSTDEDGNFAVPPSGPRPQPPPSSAPGPPAPAPRPPPVWTTSNAIAAVCQLLWNRIRPVAIAALIIFAVLVGGFVVFFLLFIPQKNADLSTTTNAAPPAETAVRPKTETFVSIPPEVSSPTSPPNVPPPVKVRLEPRAYSYTTREWANFDPAYSSGYPRVYGLGFHNRLGWGAGMTWTGNYTVSGNQISLSIESLQLPRGIEEMVARQWSQLDWWSDVGVGYHVELQGALFEDRSMAKDLFIFRTFLGDTPPPRVEKTFQIIPTANGEAPLVQVRGEWKGAYEENGDRFPFVMRLEQEGGEVSGATMEISYDRRRRSSIRGRVEGSQVTFLKRYGDGGGTVSYVSTEADSKWLQGTWQKGLEQGHWQAEWNGDFTDTVDDLSTMIPEADVARRETAVPTNRNDESWRLRPIDRHRLQRTEGSSSFSRREE